MLDQSMSAAAGCSLGFTHLLLFLLRCTHAKSSNWGCSGLLLLLLLRTTATAAAATLLPWLLLPPHCGH
jgi:hypothetical protein